MLPPRDRCGKGGEGVEGRWQKCTKRVAASGISQIAGVMVKPVSSTVAPASSANNGPAFSSSTMVSVRVGAPLSVRAASVVSFKQNTRRMQPKTCIVGGVVKMVGVWGDGAG